jgi:hypothetical protein
MSRNLNGISSWVRSVFSRAARPNGGRRRRFIPHLELLEDWQTMKVNMQYCIVTINEGRDARGLPPVAGFHDNV